MTKHPAILRQLVVQRESTSCRSPATMCSHPFWLYCNGKSGDIVQNPFYKHTIHGRLNRMTLIPSSDDACVGWENETVWKYARYAHNIERLECVLHLTCCILVIRENILLFVLLVRCVLYGPHWRCDTVKEKIDWKCCALVHRHQCIFELSIPMLTQSNYPVRRMNTHSSSLFSLESHGICTWTWQMFLRTSRFLFLSFRSLSSSFFHWCVHFTCTYFVDQSTAAEIYWPCNKRIGYGRSALQHFNRRTDYIA